MPKCDCQDCGKDHDECNCTGGTPCCNCGQCLNHCNCVACGYCGNALEYDAVADCPRCKKKGLGSCCRPPADHECKPKGWVVLSNSKKAHYFVEGRALCGKFMYLGSEYDDSNHNSPDNCAACRRKREKL